MPTPLLRNITTVSLLTVAFSWCTWLLWDQHQSIILYLHTHSIGSILFALLFAIISLLLSACAYAILINRYSKQPLGYHEIATSYFPAQVAKYLPGKIWGIIYQANKMSRVVDSIDTWRVNIELLFLSTLFSLIVVTILLFSRYIDTASTTALTIIILTIYYLLLHSSLLDNIIVSAIRIFTKKHATTSNTIPACSATMLIIIFIVEWIFYILTWQMLLTSGSTFTQAWVVSSLYIIAWLMGFIIFLAPGGLFIREITFIYLGSWWGLDKAMLIYFSMVARFFFIFSDLLLAAIFVVLPYHKPIKVKYD